LMAAGSYLTPPSFVIAIAMQKALTRGLRTTYQRMFATLSSPATSFALCTYFALGAFPFRHVAH